MTTIDERKLRGFWGASRKGRFYGAPKIDGYLSPPKYIQKNLFLEKYFFTDGELNGLLKLKHCFAVQYHGRIFITVNPCVTWVWSPQVISDFWKLQ